MCHSSTSTEAALQQPEHPVTTAAEADAVLPATRNLVAAAVSAAEQFVHCCTQCFRVLSAAASGLLCLVRNCYVFAVGVRSVDEWQLACPVNCMLKVAKLYMSSCQLVLIARL